MPINYASKYEKELAQAFTQKSVVAGNTGNDYEFTGVKEINVYTVVSQELNDYKRSGANRYGEPQEAQDTVQKMEITRDRSFAITVDKGNNAEQMGAKEASKILAIEMNEQTIPEMDMYALRTYIDNAGKIAVAAEAPTEETIVKMLSDAMVHMSNKKIPAMGRTIYIGWSYFGMLRLSKQFIGVDALAVKSLTQGTVGMFMNAKVVAVPDEYLAKNGHQAYFLVTIKSATLLPKKVQDYFIKHNPPGINGDLLEGRFLYDAFVIGAKADGVYACVAASTAQAIPTIAVSGGNATITSAGADKIRVTTDGTDPRYSKTAIETTSGGTVPVASGVTVKAVAFDNDLFTSEVAEKTA